MSEKLERIEAEHPQVSDNEGLPFCPSCNTYCLPCDVVNLARALDALTTKLKEIEASPEYREVFLLAHIHGQPYTGPQSWDEQRAAERVLAEVAGEKP